MADFTHLHVHSEYSLLDGHSRIQRLLEATRDAGMRALALTDHGGMYGSLEFYKAARTMGIKPILGVEGYLAPDIEDRSGRYDYNHLLLLARNSTGYQNLLKLTTIANTRGYHYRPRVDKQILQEHAEGLIVTSGCLSGEIPALLLKGDLNGARAAARWYRDVFGPENFYLEVQDHDAAESPQRQLNTLLYDLHRELGLPLLATNDLHYVGATDADAQDTLLCIQTGKTLEDPKRMKFDSQQYYLKTPEEMWRLFGEVPEALTNTMRVAEQCELEVEFGRKLLPSFPLPPEFASEQDYLYHLCLLGARERFGEISEAVQTKLDYEFGVIHSKGFVPYFLVVWDFVNYARTRGIRCAARGSAAGSLVAYVLGITNVDPLRYSLLFERFLNPERKSMPDIDMDFPDDRREEVIAYVAEKYGWERVAQIVTFNTLAAKAVVRDVGRVMNMSAEADRLARLIPGGPRVTLSGAMESVPEIQRFYDENARVRRLVDMARNLEGSVRGTGVHAAGVVISSVPLDTVVPLQRRDMKDPRSWLVSQYEQAHLEELGLLKMDFLGLSNLTILQNCQRFIRETRGIELDLDHLPLDDARAFELLAAGETTGVFQLESGPMRAYIRELKPTCLEDITAMVALYRPGPMDSIPTFIKAKHGEVKIRYLHPLLEPLLRESYGVIVYQDQVLQIAVELAGFTWADVDGFRKAMSKKIPEEMASFRDKFISGCEQKGIKRSVAEKIFAFIEPFAGYGFNKAHACSYAWVSYQTAYLKANYTAEFMAATLTAEASDAKKVIAAVDECRRMGVAVLPPDVNASESGFTVERVATAQGEAQAVRFGLLAIKNVGSRPVEELLEARRRGGPFTSLADLFARTESKNLTRGAVECLIKAGGLDGLGRPEGVEALAWRSRLLAGLDRAMALGQQQRRMRKVGQSSLFADASAAHSDDYIPPEVPMLPRQELLLWEKELLNLYLSAHPLAHLAASLARRVTATTATLGEESNGRTVTLGGRIASVRRIMTKSGAAMAAVQLEDMQGTIEVVVFPKAFAATEDLWREDAVLLVTGPVKLREDEAQLVCDSAEVFAATEEEPPRREFLVTIRMQRKANTILEVAYLQDVLTLLHEYPGHDRYEFVVRNGKWQARLRGGPQGVRFCQELHAELERILGPNSVEAVALPVG